MNVSEGQDINSKVFEKLEELEVKRMGKRIEKSYPTVIKRAFPNDQILESNQAVKHLKKTTNLDEGVIRGCLADLIGTNDLIPSKDSKGQLHLAKMRKIY